MGELELVPFYVEPYNSEKRWTRLEDKAHDDFKMQIRGTRDVEILHLNTYITENWKTTKVSIYDAIADNRDSFFPKHGSDWKWRSDGDGDMGESYVNTYKDPYWSFELLEEMDNSIPAKDWYGY